MYRDIVVTEHLPHHRGRQVATVTRQAGPLALGGDLEARRSLDAHLAVKCESDRENVVPRPEVRRRGRDTARGRPDAGSAPDLERDGRPDDDCPRWRRWHGAPEVDGELPYGPELGSRLELPDH